MSRSRRLICGVGMQTAGQALLMLAGLWVTPLILRQICQHDYGLWLIGQQLLTYLGLVDLGLIALVPREMGTLTGQAGGMTRLRDYLSGTLRLVLWQTPLLALAAWLIWIHLPLDWQPLHVPLGWVLIGYVLLSPLRLLQAALQGMQDFAFVSAVQTVALLTNLGVSLALLIAGAGPASLAAGWLAGQGLPPLLSWLRLRSRYPELLFTRLAVFSWAETRRQVGEGLWVTLNQMAVTLFMATDVFLMGLLIGPAAVVPYSCTQRLIHILGNQAQGGLQLSLPALAEIHAGNNRDQALAVTLSLTRCLLLASGLVVCVLLAVNGAFVTWWVGPDQYGGPLLNGLLLLAMLLRHWNTAMIFTLFCFGHNRRIPLTLIADGVVTTGISFLLISTGGPVGAPLGSLAGVCLLSLPLNLTALARTVGVGLRQLLAPLAGWLVRIVLLAAAALAASLCMPAAGTDRALVFGLLVLVAVGVTGVYGLVMWPVVQQTPLAPPLLSCALKLRAWPARRAGERGALAP